MLKISPTALKAFLACPRSWYLSHIVRASKEVPAYVMGGRDLDLATQLHMQGAPLPSLSDATRAELAAIVPELPAPGTVRVQHKQRVPCPGLEGLVVIEATADYVTPPNLDLIVVGDVKRIWAAQAAMSPEQLSDDIQAQLEAWLVWRLENPERVLFRWTYCVRETRNGTTGAVTRKAKAFSVDVKADRARVDAWFDRVVLQAAREMLEVVGPTAAVEHDPTSCEEGARCFVRHHCPMYAGPVRGESAMIDLSRFRTNNSPVPSLAQAVEEQRARIAINPPALVQTSISPAVAQASAYVAPELSVTAIEGPGAELLEAVGEEAEASETIPAPAPEPEAKPARKRRSRAEKQAEPAPYDLSGVSAHHTTASPEACGGLSARETSAAQPSIETASTEALVWELRDRGYRVYLESGPL